MIAVICKYLSIAIVLFSALFLILVIVKVIRLRIKYGKDWWREDVSRQS